MKVGAIGRLAALGVILMAAPMVPQATAQVETREGIALQNQILELQREVQALEQQQGGGYAAPTPYGQPGYGQSGASPPSGPSGDLVASLLSRVDTLESSVRDLRGQLQDLQNQLNQQSAQLNKKIDDLAFQVQNGSAAGGASGAAAGTPAIPPPAANAGHAAGTLAPPPPAAAKHTPQSDLRDGYTALQHHDYAAAEHAARSVLANKLSPHAPEAQFILAEALLGQHKFSQAAIAFDDSYNRARKGPYAPDSLLGLADSLIAINEKRAACETLTKLHTQFPNQRGDIRSGAEQAAHRAGCH